MAASTTNKSNSIRFSSGNMFLIKDGNNWVGLGHIISGKLTLKTDKNSITLADGETISKRGKRECSLQITLAQTDEIVQDKIFDLIGKSLPIYYYNGLEDGKHQEYYFPSGEIIESFDIDMKGDAHQSIALDITISPATSGNATIPANGLPDEAYANDTNPITGSNPYYVVVDTTAT